MADIEVRERGDAFDVTVADGGTETTHEVTLSEADWERLGSGYEDRAAFVRACFEFLLAREPKESILRSFDVSVIPRYFPEFEETIRR